LSFNKIIETKLAQIAAAFPVNNEGKIPGQPENSLEKVNAVTTIVVSPLVIHQTLTIKQEKHKGNRTTDLHHQQKHKKTKKKMRKRHNKTLLIQATCCFPQGRGSRPWMSNSLVLWR
jgi:hypothetical protein